MNWTDTIESAVDVHITAIVSFLEIDFARIPDVVVIQDLMLLDQKPGYKVDREKETKYIIFKPNSTTVKALIKAVTKMLESHGLTVATKEIL